MQRVVSCSGTKRFVRVDEEDKRNKRAGERFLKFGAPIDDVYGNLEP